ncbi:MAG: NGG1p interacting factor NIF3 [Kiritimatiellae bacterium]|nr:NGG1p interacting factor NIF3 [Kiritimatiellia bacterium]
MLKLTVYIPATHLEQVKRSLFEAGAGRYARYDCCSWQVLGEGQFRPLSGIAPFLGKTGEIEKVPEYRVEMLCAEECVEAVTAALRRAHPYEEPAFDFVALAHPSDL